jgi:hypothetical protein
MDYTSTKSLDGVLAPACSSDRAASLEVSGVGCSGDTFTAAVAAGGGPTKDTRKRGSEMAIDLDIPDTSPHLQCIRILLLVLSS